MYVCMYFLVQQDKLAAVTPCQQHVAGTWAVHALRGAMQASEPLHMFVLKVHNTVNTFNEEQRKTSWPIHQGLNATAMWQDRFRAWWEQHTQCMTCPDWPCA